MPLPTFYARKLESLLKKLGIKVEEEVFDGHKHIDLSIDAAKLDIEVDGMHHLTNSSQMLADIERSKYSRIDGYETIHVHNLDIKQGAEDIAQAIAQVSSVREEKLDEMYGIKTELA